MFMDLGASTTFIVEPEESNVMNRPPRNPKQPILHKKFNMWVLTGMYRMSFSFIHLSSSPVIYLLDWNI